MDLQASREALSVVSSQVVELAGQVVEPRHDHEAALQVWKCEVWGGGAGGGAQARPLGRTGGVEVVNCAG